MTTRSGNIMNARVAPYTVPDVVRTEVLRGLLGEPKTLPPKQSGETRRSDLPS